MNIILCLDKLYFFLSFLRALYEKKTETQIYLLIVFLLKFKQKQTAAHGDRIGLYFAEASATRTVVDSSGNHCIPTCNVPFRLFFPSK